MDTISEFCTMWQNIFANAKSVADWTELDIQRIIDWAHCCETAIVDDLKLTAQDVSEQDVANFNAAVAEQFLYLPPSPNYVADLASATYSIVKALVQNPYLSEELLDHLVRTLTRNNSLLTESVANSVEECVAERNLLEVLLSSEAFQEASRSSKENLVFKARARMLFKKLHCLWTLVPPGPSGGYYDDDTGREKCIKTILATEHLDSSSSPVVGLYLLKEVAVVDGLNELVYNHTLSQHKTMYNLEADTLDDETVITVLASVSAKYPGFFSGYALHLLRQLHELEGASLSFVDGDDDDGEEKKKYAVAKLGALKKKLGALANAGGKMFNAIRKLLTERRDRPMCERRDIYNQLLDYIAAS